MDNQAGADTKNTLTQFIWAAIIATLAAIAGYILGPVEVRYLEQLSNNSVLIGTTFAVGSISLAVLSIYIGRISDRLGRKKVILAGLALGVIYPLLYAATFGIFRI
jgi:MFS family permease